MKRKKKSKLNSKSLKINKNSKTIQNSTNDTIETPLPQDWNSNLVLSKIFERMKFKDLVNLNTVCHQWNQLINPLIYKSLKILRHRYVENGYHDKNLSKDDKLAAEVNECIDNNIKHKHLVQEFKLRSRLPPNLTQQFFGAFCYLSKFTIFNIKTSQDILLTCLKPLNYLKELNLEQVTIEEIKRKEFVSEPVQLPLSLTKIKIANVNFIKDPKLIKETLCSHTNLEEFALHVLSDSDLLSPFNTHYPTLQKFSYLDQYHSSPVTHLYDIIESNPQLTELHLKSNQLNSHIVTLINSNLTNLTELTLRGSRTRGFETSIDARFTQPMELTKFILYWKDLTPAAVDSILTNLPNLKDLHVSIDYEYTPLTSIISKRCKHLTQLTYNATQLKSVRFSQTNSFNSFFQKEFSQNQYQCNQTLRSLNFCHCHLGTLRPEYLKQFPNLQIINFNQIGFYYNREEIEDLKYYLNTFRDWKVKVSKRSCSFNGYLYKPNSQVIPVNLEEYQEWD